MTKTFRRALLALSIAFAFAGIRTLGQQGNTVGDTVELPVVSPESVPPTGTFFMLSSLGTNGFGPPWPFNPLADQQLEVLWLGTNSLLNLPAGAFIVDDTVIDYAALNQQMAMTAEAPPAPGEGEGDPGGGDIEPMPAYAYAPNAFWIEIISATGSVANVVLHGTVPDVNYEILSKESLTNSNWTSEGTVLGSVDQDWTPAAVAIGSRTNSLFLWARSWVDEDGDGLPSWWEQQFGLDPNNPDTGDTGVPDGYKNPEGDGWDNLYKYQHGMNPNVAYTPPPPRNVTARVDATGTNVILSWQSGGGQISNYSIREGWFNDPLSQFFEIGQVAASALTFTAVNEDGFVGTPWIQPAYFVRANFSDGSHSDSEVVIAYKPALSLDVNIVRGPLRERFLTVAAPPANLSHVLLFWQKPDFSTGYLSVYASNLVNGIAPLPTMPGFDFGTFNYQIVSTNGDFGKNFASSERFADEKSWSYASIEGFADARMHVKENLRFLLRSATATRPFSYTSDMLTGASTPALSPQTYFISQPESYYARPPSPAMYEYYGFHFFSSNFNYSVMQELRPVQENHLWRNFVFDLDDYGLTGADYSFDPESGRFLRTLVDPLYTYTGNGTETNPLVAFDGTNSSWLFYGGLNPYSSYFGTLGPEVGVNFTIGVGMTLANNVDNCYGLRQVSLMTDSEDLLLPGSSTLDYPAYGYPNFTAPALRIVDYYFASQTPHFRFDSTPPPLPGSPDFSVTNTSPLVMASVGEPLTVAGWAKMEITNGYAGKYGYLEQYFDKAYAVSAAGQITTNQTGILSPYGEFFPTEPGRAALVTMPDVDTGERGTGIVHVIKLQLDVNHDGVMDLAFGGRDNTSRDRPFVFWVNNDNDAPAITNGASITPERDIETLPNDPVTQDWHSERIESQRNLEDFARLWITGLPALPSTQGLSAKLSLIPSSGSPSLNLYRAFDTEGSDAYITNITAAASQFTKVFLSGLLIFDYAKRLSEISPTATYTLPVNVSDGQPQFTRFLFEGSGTGAGELVLTLYQGTNVLAQSSAFIELRDIKELYERVIVTNVLQNWPAMVDQTRTSDFEVLHSPQPWSESHEVAVFVHGWRLTPWASHNFAETTFKRLYWKGFQGRFALVSWPTRSEETEVASWLQYLTFNRSEHTALKSGAGIAQYLQSLRTRFPGSTISVYSHSLGAAAVTEALRELVNANQRPLDNYVMAQSAFPAQVFDVTMTNFPSFMTVEQAIPTPNTYHGYGSTINNGLRSGGTIVNFFNPVDFALSSEPGSSLLAGAWQENQRWLDNSNPTNPITMKPNTYLGYYTDGTNSIVRRNEFNRSPGALLYGGFYNGQTRTVTNTHELMAFVARSRTKALGVQANVGGVLSTSDEVNLNTQLGFGNARDDHSGQFHQNIQALPTQLFYSQLLNQLFPPQ